MNPDGGVPFLAEKDVWISALAGRTLSELAPARGPVPRIGEFVADRQLPDGGWGFCRDTAQQAEAEDPAFAARLRKTWQHANPERGSVVNRIAGKASGKVVQARDMNGDVTF
jgi:hypothetical protein